MNLKSILAGAAAVAVLGNVSAAVFVTSAGSTAGNSANAGAVSLIWYSPSATFDISSLGVFAPTGGSDVLTVSLWTEGAGSPTRTVSIDTSTGTPDSNGFLYSSVPTFTTAPSGHYALTVSGYVSNQIGDRLGTDATVNYDASLYTAISGILNWDGSTNPYLNSNYIDPTRFSFASFGGSLTPVPEPEVYASIAGLALVGYGLFRRQARK